MIWLHLNWYAQIAHYFHQILSFALACNLHLKCHETSTIISLLLLGTSARTNRGARILLSPKWLGMAILLLLKHFINPSTRINSCLRLQSIENNNDRYIVHVTTFLPSFTSHRRGRNCCKRYKVLAGVWRISILMRKLSANKSYTWHVCRLAWVHFNRVMDLTMFWGKHEYKFHRHWIMLSYLRFTEEIWCSQWTYGVGARIELIDSHSVFFPKIFRPGPQIRNGLTQV